MKIELTPFEFSELVSNSTKFGQDLDHFKVAMTIALNGQRLQAIKHLRDNYGFGLKQAKDIIDLVDPNTNHALRDRTW